MHMAQASLYSHSTPDDLLMSRVTYNDGGIDMENPVMVNSIAKRPNIRMCLEEDDSPIFELQDPTEWVAGPQLINTTDESGAIFSIKNIGGETLTINDISDLSSTEFATDFDVNITLEAGEEYYFSFTYTSYSGCVVTNIVKINIS
jgi:hypothetical protein